MGAATPLGSRFARLDLATPAAKPPAADAGTPDVTPAMPTPAAVATLAVHKPAPRPPHASAVTPAMPHPDAAATPAAPLKARAPASAGGKRVASSRAAEGAAGVEQARAELKARVQAEFAQLMASGKGLTPNQAATLALQRASGCA